LIGGTAHGKRGVQGSSVCTARSSPCSPAPHTRRRYPDKIFGKVTDPFRRDAAGSDRGPAAGPPPLQSPLVDRRLRGERRVSVSKRIPSAPTTPCHSSSPASRKRDVLVPRRRSWTTGSSAQESIRQLDRWRE
jgi:hypothetical protein